MLSKKTLQPVKLVSSLRLVRPHKTTMANPATSPDPENSPGTESGDDELSLPGSHPHDGAYSPVSLSESEDWVDGLPSDGWGVRRFSTGNELPFTCFGPSPITSFPDYSEEPQIDDVIDAIGAGRWTALYFLVAALVPMSLVGNLLVAEFTAPSLNFTCVEASGEGSPSLIGDDLHYKDYTDLEDYGYYPEEEEMDKEMDYDYYVGEDISVIQSGDSRPECFIGPKASLTSDGVVMAKRKCTEFSFSNATVGHTVTQEFELVCALDWLRPMFQLVFTLGCLVGAGAGGLLGDRYGRQKTVFYGTVMSVAVTILLLTAPIIEVVFVSRFLLGTFIYIAINPLTTLGLEICPLYFRYAFGPVESLPYALMLPVLAGTAYICRDWRRLQVWLTVPLLLGVLLANPLVLDESPRWLVSRGRLAEAERVIRRAARMQGTEDQLPRQLPELLETAYKKHSLTSAGSDLSLWSLLWSLVSTAEMRTITLVTLSMWFIEGALYISLPLQANSYDSPYLYLASLGILELPGSFLVAPLGRAAGRKMTCFGLSLVTAAAMLGQAFLRVYGEKNDLILGALSVMSYVAMVGVSQMVILFTSEVFPTTVRSLGSSMGYFMNNIGNCFPPFLDIVLPADSPYLYPLVYGGMAITNALLVLFIPETSNRRLYDTVEEHVQDERAKKRRTARRVWIF